MQKKGPKALISVRKIAVVALLICGGIITICGILLEFMEFIDLFGLRNLLLNLHTFAGNVAIGALTAYIS